MQPVRLVREEVLLAGLCERKILFQLEIYDRLRQATANQQADECPLALFVANSHAYF